MKNKYLITGISIIILAIMLMNAIGVDCTVYATTSDDENSDAFQQALYEEYLYNKYY